jgi:hypothetical protein
MNRSRQNQGKAQINQQIKEKRLKRKVNPSVSWFQHSTSHLEVN